MTKRGLPWASVVAPLALATLPLCPVAANPRRAVGSDRLGRITFASDRKGSAQSIFHVIKLHADGSNAVQLTDDLMFDVGPAWFPGSRRIALSRADDICVIAAGSPGTDPTKLARRAANESSTDRSLDGRRIAFSASMQFDWRSLL